MYQDVQQTNYVNGGQYIYLDGGAAVKNISWDSYYDHFEEDNVWSRGHDNIPENI